jgi:hypothetical protein
MLELVMGTKRQLPSLFALIRRFLDALSTPFIKDKGHHEQGSAIFQQPECESLSSHCPKSIALFQKPCLNTAKGGGRKVFIPNGMFNVVLKPSNGHVAA